jgi:hypothetical protein
VSNAQADDNGKQNAQVFKGAHATPICVPFKCQQNRKICCLTSGRSAAPNRLTVSSGARALAARLYHGTIGLGCLEPAEVGC